MVPRSVCTQTQYGAAGSRWKTSTRSSTPISFIGGKPVAALALPDPLPPCGQVWAQTAEPHIE